MEEDIISELRNILQEVVVPDLKLLVAKIENLQHCIEFSNKAVEARFDAFRLEIETMRGEMKTLREEMNQLGAALGSHHSSRVQAVQQENPANGEEQTAASDSPVKQWVN